MLHKLSTQTHNIRPNSLSFVKSTVLFHLWQSNSLLRKILAHCIVNHGRRLLRFRGADDQNLQYMRALNVWSRSALSGMLGQFQSLIENVCMALLLICILRNTTLNSSICSTQNLYKFAKNATFHIVIKTAGVYYTHLAILCTFFYVFSILKVCKNSWNIANANDFFGSSTCFANQCTEKNVKSIKKFPTENAANAVYQVFYLCLCSKGYAARR